MDGTDPTPQIALEDIELFCHGLDHAEGITVTPDGTIYVGGEAGQIYRVEPDGTPLKVHDTGGFMLGLACDKAGYVYAIDMVGPHVWRVDIAANRREIFFEGTPARPCVVPNWGAFDASGNYYITDSGAWDERNGLIYVRRAGGEAAIWTEESANFPNGLCVDADSKNVYVAESMPSALVRYAINEDGSAGPREVLCELGLMVPDGVALAIDGSVLLSCYRPDAIYRWTPRDGLATFALDPRGTTLAAPTNIVFTGPQRNVIVVPNLGRWHLSRFTSDLVGVGLHYPSAEAIG